MTIQIQQIRTRRIYPKSPESKDRDLMNLTVC